MILVSMIVGLFGLLLAANFAVYEEGDFDSVQDEVVIVCDTSWLQKPINCKPVFPDGFDFSSGSTTTEFVFP